MDAFKCQECSYVCWAKANGPQETNQKKKSSCVMYHLLGEIGLRWGWDGRTDRRRLLRQFLSLWKWEYLAVRMDCVRDFQGNSGVHNFSFITDFRTEPFSLPRCDSTQLCSVGHIQGDFNRWSSTRVCVWTLQHTRNSWGHRAYSPGKICYNPKML